MASVWAKMDALLPQHPKAYRAGFWGTTVFAHLILLNKAHGCGGIVPAHFIAPAYLARYIQLDAALGAAEAEKMIRLGLRLAREAKLIDVNEQGALILGWGPEWDKQATSGAERTRKWRENQRRDDAVTDGDGTVTELTGDDRSDQNRSEQSRSDQSIQDEPGEAVPVEKPKAKKKPKELDPDKIPERAHLAAQVLADYVVENNPDGDLAAMQPAERARSILKSADQLRIHNAKHDWATIDAMITWSQRDAFWAPLVHDGTRLRKHWNTMAGQRNGKAQGHEDVTVGQVEPAPHSAHEGGEVQL